MERKPYPTDLTDEQWKLVGPQLPSAKPGGRPRKANRQVTAELRRQDLLAETDRYLADLVADVGAPSAAQRARASAIASNVARRRRRKAG